MLYNYNIPSTITESGVSNTGSELQPVLGRLKPILAQRLEILMEELLDRILTAKG